MNSDSKKMADGIREALNAGIGECRMYFSPLEGIPTGGCALTLSAVGVTRNTIKEIADEVRGCGSNNIGFAKLMKVSEILAENVNHLHSRGTFSALKIAEMLDKGIIPETELIDDWTCFSQYADREAISW